MCRQFDRIICYSTVRIVIINTWFYADIHRVR